MLEDSPPPLRTANDSQLARSRKAAEGRQVRPTSGCSDSLRSGNITILTTHTWKQGLDKELPGGPGLEPRLLNRLKEQMGLRMGPKSLCCVPGLRQTILLLRKAAGEKSTGKWSGEQRDTPWKETKPNSSWQMANIWIFTTLELFHASPSSNSAELGWLCKAAEWWIREK